MLPMTSAQIRQAFLDFFASKGHQVVASSSLLLSNDPTLMFANAGMVQFKDLFTGREKRAYSRACSSQKCMRVRGKHNDLENVGRTARHHTFFEMLGNFSFGDYFKEDAIAFAWELFTRVFDLPKDRLMVTVFGGEAGVPADDEAFELWRKVTGFGEERIRRLGLEENFWSMGETGPCGPCSEIHFFHGDNPDPATFGSDPSVDGTGWVELWNLVFMQFDRSVEDGKPKLSPLPAPSIDTGAGLERVAGALQGHCSNYDTDLFRPLIEKAAALAGKRYGGSMSEDDVSLRVIADHARAAAFLIAEGVLPDRTGPEYVLRRVMRRAIRHGHRLGIARPFLHEVALEVVQLMGEPYRELRERRDLIASVTEQEEVRFRQTLDRGLRILDEELSKMRAANGSTLSGDAAFKLYDTYGFPIDLTEVICQEKGVLLDRDGYQRALEAAGARSEFVSQSAAVESVYREVLGKVPSSQVRFVGYEREKAEADVVALVKAGALVERASAGDEIELVLDRTPFYGEAGGQIGDRGVISAEGLRIDITDTQKPMTGLVVHHGEVRQGEVSVGLRVTADVERVLTMTTDSVELCGGTHARATGDIGLFKIVGEGGIAAGVRRIEAVTGRRALAYVRSLESTVAQAAALARAGGGDLVEKIEKLVSRERELDKKVVELSKKLAMGGGGGEGALLAQARDVGGIKVLAVAVEVTDVGALREMAEKLRDKLGDSVVLVGSKAGTKVQLVLTVSKALSARLKAPELIRPVAQIVGGSGGGRPDMAQAGGTDTAKLDEALESLERVVRAATGGAEEVRA